MFRYHFIGKLLVVLCCLFTIVDAKNGFDLKGSLIPVAEILRGGPPKDGIPAIDNPKFIKASRAIYLKNSDEVIGVNLGGITKAYPINILNWHEVVNDKVGSTFISVTYCPLCGSGLVFDAKVKGDALLFGVSGLLYNSDVLLYDKKTESLWSQLEMKAVTGKFRGTNLKVLPSLRTSWGNWKRRHPDTLVLSKETGFARNYSRDPYAGYESSRRLFFPVNKESGKYHSKERVLAVDLGRYKKAYPFVELNRTNQPTINDEIGGRKVKIVWDKASQSGEIFDSNGKKLPSFTLFWFAWYAFNSEGQVYQVN